MLRKLYLHKNYIGSLAFAFIFSLLISPIANATSIYDGLRVTQEAKLQRSTCNDIDLSTSWFNTAVSYFGENNQQAYASSLPTFVDDNHYWGVFVQKADTNNTSNLVFFSHKKTDTLDHYTFAKDSSSNASNYQDQILYIPVDWSNYESDTFTTFTLYLDPSSCEVQGQKNIGADFVGSTEGGGGFGMRVNDLWSNLYPDGWTTTQNSMYFLNMPFVEPSGYDGEHVSGNEDTDGDGLSLARELTQGTSDVASHEDTDGDGLDDYIESQWNLDRNDVFCGSLCAYPNPTTKDLYAEVDWMKEPSTNGRSFQPTSTQITTVKDAYAAKGITAHFDTGQYGGGNELPSYTQSLRFIPDQNNTDFYDYKNGNSSISANFNSDRNKIWHYVVSGYQYNEDPGSSGVSYTGDDDSFVSTGLIKDGQSGFGYLDFDTALSGTLIHELGHGLCLSSEQKYTSQPQQCIYSGIDSSNAASTYLSSMNYSYQMFIVDYSSGQNAPNDHDDWNAIASGMKDFADPDRNPGDSLEHGKATKEKKVKKGISITQAQELRKKGKLGKKNINFFNSITR